MNDEMKEPNEEQALSSSDERKPNIEGKKFSAGADNAPSPEKQPSNEDDVACTKDERDSHLTRVIHKFGGKKRVAIAAAAVVAVIFCLPMLFPQFFAPTNYGPTQPAQALAHAKAVARPRGSRSDTNGKKPHVRLRRPVNVAVKPKENPLVISQAHGLPKSTTWTQPRRK